jgi:RsiW-degrading membrane proteinase PrsW (M82 family)
MVNLVVLFWIVIAFGYFLSAKFRKDKKLKRAWWDFADHKWLMIVVLALAASLLFINAFIGDPQFPDPNARIAYGNRTHQPWLVSDGYRELVNSDPRGIDNSFELVHANFDENQRERPYYHDKEKEQVWIYNHFKVLSEGTNPELRDIGFLGLTAYYFFRNDQINAKDKLEEIENKELKYYNYFSGLLSFYYNDPDAAISFYKREIALNGYKEGAYDDLAYTYAYTGSVEELEALVYTEEGKKYVPSYQQEAVYYHKGDWGNYFSIQFGTVFSEITPIAFAGALLVMITWIFYLRRISRGGDQHWHRIISTILLAAVFILPVWFLYDVFKYELHFQKTGETINDLLYCILSVGVLEEFVKILPFLLILRFTNWIREPIDYIVYASLTAIGFAFMENLMYFTIDRYGIDTIHSRAFSAVISHMIDSSIIAYGLILAKFRFNKHPALYFFPFFIIAAVSHGFYDFWIINDHVREFSILTLVYLFTSVLFYSSFINNALNNSPSVQQNIRINTRLLSADLAASLIFVLVFEFIALAFVYGTVIANREFFSSIITGGYMILFLSVRLSNIDIIPGEWAPIQFFTSLNPLNIAYNTKLNYNSVVGLKLRFTPARKTGILYKLLPATGEVIKREKISGFYGWFLVKMDQPIMIAGRTYPFVFIRAKEKSDLIENNGAVVISFNVPVSSEVLEKEEKKKSDLLFADWAVVN